VVRKPWYKKWWVWAIVIVVIIAIAANGGDNEDNKQETTGDIAPPTETASNDPEPEDLEPDNQDDARIITSLGDSVTTDNFIVTLEEFNRIESDNEFNTPEDGNEFVEAVLLIENKSDKDFSVSSIIMFEAYCDGFSVSESLSAQVASGNSTMDGGLAAGKKLKGALAYELPQNWEELEIHIDLTALSLFSSDGEIKIILQN